VLTPANRLGRLAAALAALVVALLAGWLILRLLGAGSDAGDARERQRQHTTAATALAALAGAVQDPAALATATPERISQVSALAVAPVTLLQQAGSTADAAALTRANTDLLAVRPITPAAATRYAGTVTGLVSSERSRASRAAAAADRAASTRTWSIRYLAVLVVVAAAGALAGVRLLTAHPSPATRQPAQPGRIPAEPAVPPPARFAAPPSARGAAPPPARGAAPPPARGAGLARSRLAATTSAHPGISLDAAVHGGVVIYAGSVIGPEHRGGKNFVPRQDAYSWAPGHDASVIVMAVADGVGSARNSHAAALLATETAVAQLRTASSADVSTWFDRPDLWGDQAHRLIGAVAQRLHPQEVDQRAAMIELATGDSLSGQRGAEPATTLVVAVGLISGDGIRVLWASVGDSQVSLLAPGATQLSWSQREPDASAGTRALPRDVGAVISAQYFLPAGHAFLLTTDGCEQVLGLDPGAVPLLRDLIQHPGDTGRLLELLQRTPPGAGDDRTLVLFAPMGGL
jgi:Protein phosphatase 2C